MDKNLLLIAGAGTGKTTYLINEALKIKDKRILITTYTINCRKEIESKILKVLGYIPKNIYIQTWFSFLLEHGIMPYKKTLQIEEVNGVCFIEGKSGLKYKSKNGFPVYYGEKDFEKYYFDNNHRIYTDKLSKLVIRIDISSNKCVINRISKIFDYIFIDEVQDMVGYDLEIIKMLLFTNSNVKLVGDPRQNIYNTHCAELHKKYSMGNIDQFIKEQCKSVDCLIDDKSLTKCNRCHKDIIKFVNNFYLGYEPLQIKEIEEKEHQGVYIITKNSVNQYLETYNPMQLIYDSKTTINKNYNFTTFGKSKGATYDRVLLYPTKEFEKYLKGKKYKIEGITKNKMYVAMTRAVNSLTFVCDDVDNIYNIESAF